MSFDECTEYDERRTPGITNNVVGGCGKHPGQPLVNCPKCATETPTPKRNLQELAIDYNLSGDELLMCSNYLVAIRLSKKGIKPEELMHVINNWERIKKAIAILKHDFDL